MALVVILTEILFQDQIFRVELDILSELRENYHDYSTLEYFWNVIIRFADLDTMTFIMAIMYQFIDPLISLKISLLTFIMMFIVALLKLLYATPRPFWMDTNIDVPVWFLDYSGPSDHLFVGVFLYSYTIYNVFMDNIEGKRGYFFVWILLSINGLFMLTIALALFFLGQTFFFSSIVGALYSIILVIVCIKQDYFIHKWCQYIAFDIYKSRRYKFYVLFICLLLLVVIVVYYRLNVGEYGIQASWLRSKCLQKMNRKSEGKYVHEVPALIRYRVGIDYTYFDFEVLAKICGCTIGGAYYYLNEETVIWK